MTTDDTPVRPFNFGSACARIRPARSPSEPSDETAYSRMGRLLVVKVRTVDAGVCAGSSGRARETAVLTSCWAVLRSTPSLKVTTTRDDPWLEVDWTVSAPL